MIQCPSHQARAGRTIAAEPVPAFGALLRRKRLAAGTTQEALAELAGLSVRAISDLERTGPTAIAAARLFVERARAAHRDFTVAEETATAVARICHRRDGLPLAIELAAARTKLLSPRALLAKLDERFSLLVGGARDWPERHQTLRAAVACGGLCQFR